MLNYSDKKNLYVYIYNMLTNTFLIPSKDIKIFINYKRVRIIINNILYITIKHNNNKDNLEYKVNCKKSITMIKLFFMKKSKEYNLKKRVEYIDTFFNEIIKQHKNVVAYYYPKKYKREYFCNNQIRKMFNKDFLDSVGENLVINCVINYNYIYGCNSILLDIFINEYKHIYNMYFKVSNKSVSYDYLSLDVKALSNLSDKTKKQILDFVNITTNQEFINKVIICITYLLPKDKRYD